MSFTVQRTMRGTTTGHQQKWEVVLNHEHIMFTGDYRQCEDWLDRHEIHVPAANKQVTLFERMSATVRNILRCSLLDRAGRSARSFLKSSAGYSPVGDSLLTVLLVALFYLGTLFSSSAVAWQRLALACCLQRLPYGTQTSITLPNSDCPACPQESLDIACDLAQSNN